VTHVGIAPLAPAATDSPLLQVVSLSRSYGGVKAVIDVSFDVPPRGITGLIGPNGAGKSTVAGIIAGAIRQTTGHITFGGRDISHSPPHARANVGLIRTFQMSGEFSKLTVLENLIAAVPSTGESIGGAFLRRSRWRSDLEATVARAVSLLERFEMTSKTDTWAGDLSGGQKRLVEIMRGLMASPKLLLLDEPMAGVNPALRSRIEAHLLELRDEGLPMLMIEHELGVVERCCEHVLVMARGLKLAEGTMADHRANEDVRRAYLG
jgi:branched-chain amino acid transport system ATP-binding protein/branched-chain amino acid transport system permease protein